MGNLCCTSQELGLMRRTIWGGKRKVVATSLVHPQIMDSLLTVEVVEFSAMLVSQTGAGHVILQRGR